MTSAVKKKWQTMYLAKVTLQRVTARTEGTEAISLNTNINTDIHQKCGQQLQGIPFFSQFFFCNIYKITSYICDDVIISITLLILVWTGVE